jgi:hypothetical protein
MPSYGNGPRAFRASTGPLAIRRRTPVSRFACVFFIAFLSTAASCSQLTQKDDDRKEMGRQLTEGYYSCVRTSFASQLPTMVDRNMAIDQAFKVCQTEESKLQTFENSLSQNDAATSAHRNKLKEELLRR